MDTSRDATEAHGGVGSQVYTTLCVNLLTVRLVTENYDNEMVRNKTTRSIGEISLLHAVYDVDPVAFPVKH